MANPSKESFDPAKGYVEVVCIEDRDAQGWAHNELQDIRRHAHRQLGDRIFKEAAVVRGLVPSVGSNGQITISDGDIWTQGDVASLAGATLTYSPTKASGLDVIYARYLLDQVTQAQDSTLSHIATGEAVEERYRRQVSLVNTTPDAFDEQFETWDGDVPAKWTVVSGVTQRGTPAKFRDYALEIVHTSGIQSRVEALVDLTPGQTYTLYVWVRVKDGSVDLPLAAGATIGLTRGSPSWTPTPIYFSATTRYQRFAVQFTADASSNTATLFINIPASAGVPSTHLLVDAVLMTTIPLSSLELDRHYVPLYYWDRATNAVTRAIPRASNIKQADLEPPLPGPDIIEIEQNTGLQDWTALHVNDIYGSFRVPPALLLERDASADTATQLGVKVGGGRCYVKGYKVDKLASTLLLLDKALSYATITNESFPYTFGQNRYTLTKAALPDDFPIRQVNSVQVTMEEELTFGAISGGVDNMPAGYSSQNIVNVSDGTPGQFASTTAGPDASGTYTFTDDLGNNPNNKLVIRVTKYDDTAGSDITYLFNRGNFTIDQIVEALNRGSGPALRSVTIPATDLNVMFLKNGSNALTIRTKTRGANASLIIQNSSTCLTKLGLTAATYTGTGARYAETTSWLDTNPNVIDWSPGGAEPSGTHYCIVRRTIDVTQSTDFALGGLFPSPATTYLYKVTAWGPSGEGIASVAVSRLTPAGSINAISWASVPGAISYTVYRSSDGGANYYYLGNLKDQVGQTLTFLDDGSFAHNTNFPLGAAIQTTLNGAVAAGAATVNVATNGANPFPSSGTLFIDGSDNVTYSGKTASSFTGCSGAVAHASGAVVTLGPTMTTVSIAEGELGVLNFAPAGFEPLHGQNVIVSYDYYQPHIYSICVDKKGAILAVKGKPADHPAAPVSPVDTLLLGQVQVSAVLANSTITNNALIDRPVVTDLRRFMNRLEDLYYNSINQQIMNEIEGRTDQTTDRNRGIFVDAMAGHDQHDTTYNVNGVVWNAELDSIHYALSVPSTKFDYTLGVNSNPVKTTTDTKNNKQYLHSTQMTLLQQDQWSEWMNINPYNAYVKPPAQILIDPQSLEFSLKGSTDEAINAMLEVLRKELYAIGGQRGPRPGIRMVGVIRIVIPGQPDQEVTIAPRTPLTKDNIERAIAQVRKIIEDAINNTGAARIYLDTITIYVTGQSFVGGETNIRGKFGSTYVDLVAVAPTAAGTPQGGKATVNADSAGRFTAKFTIPASTAAGLIDVKCEGPYSSASRIFNGTLVTPDLSGIKIINKVHRCPIAESFSFDEDVTISGVGFYVDYIDRGKPGVTAPTEPLEIQLQTMIAGFPSGDVVASKMLNPATDLNWGGKTQVFFDDYLLQAKGDTYCLTYLSNSNRYIVQVAKLGGLGKNPSALITQQPYLRGTLFASANNETWTALQEYDLRFEVYGRQFDLTGQVEFTSLSTDNLTDFWLAASQLVPVGCDIAWEYEVNGTSTLVYPTGLLDKIPVPIASPMTSIIVRAKFTSASAKVSPRVDLNTLLMKGFRNAAGAGAGSYVSRQIAYTQALSRATLVVGAYVPAGAALHWYVSRDDGVTWERVDLDADGVTVVTPTTRAIDDWFTEYQWPAKTFQSGSSDTKKFRVRCTLDAPTPALQVPVISSLGVVLQ